jgi:DegV family protein with EDD domain
MTDMKDFVIMTDSCCDMTAQLAEELELSVLPLSLMMGDETYRNWLDGREIGFHEFYERIRSGASATTSAVSVGDFEEAMRPLLQEGKDILYLAFSSGLSTTYQSAVIAADSLQEEFPDARIFVVDTLAASLGQGLLVYLCVQQKRAGKRLEEVRDYAEATKRKVCHWFTVDDLNHLKRGGRINAATALFGTMLAIKPVLHVDDEGHLIAVSKTRGRKASLLALVDKMAETADDPAHQTVFISHGDCEEDARFVADEIRRRFGTEDIRINYVGPVIGNHSGPGTLALFFLGQPR